MSCTRRNGKWDQVVIPLQSSPRWLKSTSEQSNLAFFFACFCCPAVIPDKRAARIAQTQRRVLCLWLLAGRCCTGCIFLGALAAAEGAIATATKSTRAHSQTFHLQTASHTCCSHCPHRVVIVVFIVQGHKNTLYMQLKQNI